MPLFWRVISFLLVAGSVFAFADAKPPAPQAAKKRVNLWALKPVVRPDVPSGFTTSANPIDAFVAELYKNKDLHPVEQADRATLLRRVYIDLIGMPPARNEQDAFAADDSPDAYDKVVDRLLASEQHGVHYARHWLDVLRYADVDERMPAASGIYLWREWMIHALNRDMPYDEFVRAQLTGKRGKAHTQISATGVRSKVQGEPEDLFALGFLARGGTSGRRGTGHDLAFSSVETVSSALMGMTVACAKCHDHMFDPISQRDYYSMEGAFRPARSQKNGDGRSSGHPTAWTSASRI